MTKDMQAVVEEVRRVAAAMQRGALDERACLDRLSPGGAELATVVNGMLDTLVRPLRVAAGAIKQISVGVFPDFVIDDYEGEFNDIKKSINTFLAVMYGMHHETQALIDAIRRGRLNTRGNDWDFEGAWRELIHGLNETLDAVVDPIREASGVLDRLAQYELCARVEGRYRGDHAKIKRSLNATAGALHDAIAQVAAAVEEVSSVGERIAGGSQVIAEGASVQVAACSETAGILGRIDQAAKQTTGSADDARRVASEARAASDRAKSAMTDMASVMHDICTSAANTSAIISEINGISAQTDELADGASREASKVGTSGRGFAVVANEVRKLAARSQESAQRMRDVLAAMRRQDGTTSSDAFALDDAIKDIERVALQSNQLALNAAVEAAHVEAACAGFERLTQEVRGLAQRAKDAATRTETLTSRALDLARSGEAAAGDVGDIIARSLDDVRRVTMCVEDAASAAHRQTEEIGAASGAMARMQQVATEAEAEAGRWYDMSEELARQTTALQQMVARFDLRRSVAQGELPAEGRARVSTC